MALSWCVTTRAHRREYPLPVCTYHLALPGNAARTSQRTAIALVYEASEWRERVQIYWLQHVAAGDEVHDPARSAAGAHTFCQRACCVVLQSHYLCLQVYFLGLFNASLVCQSHVLRDDQALAALGRREVRVPLCFRLDVCQSVGVMGM